MTAQHKAPLDKVLQSAFAHRAAGSLIAETTASIEAMILSGIDTATAVDSQDEDSIRRFRSAIAHRDFGKRLQDAWETLQLIISDESLSLEAEDRILVGQHKAPLSKLLISACNSKRLGRQLADMADLQDKVLDELLVIYGPGGAKDDTPTYNALLAIKNA